MIKHELAHVFFKIVSQFKYQPIWLWEGVSLYLAGQNTTRKKPERLKGFLEHYDDHAPVVYHESGFAIEYIVKKHGKVKLMRLIKSLKDIKSKEKFKKKFKDIYGFLPEYKYFQD